MEDWKGKTLYEGVILVAVIAVTKWLLKNFKASVINFRKKLTDTDKIDEIEQKVIYGDQYMQAIVHINIYPMYILDVKSGNLIYVNPAWCELFGFSDPEDAYGMGFMRAVPDEDIERMNEENERFIKHPSNFDGIVKMKNIKTGEIIKCKCRNELIKDKSGIPIQAMGILKVI